MTTRKPTPAKTTTAGGKGARAAIYALTAPGSDEIRYIGKANNPKDRLQGHIRDARTRKTPVYSWIRKLGAQGLAPEMRVLEWADDWVEAERRLIALHRPSGRLLNLADGGNEPKCTTEQRQVNARILNQRLEGAPQLRRIRDLKRSIANGLKSGHVRNETRAKLRRLAVKFPALFGGWLNIPDQEVSHAG